MANKGTEYEKLVQDIFQAIVDYERCGLKHIAVRHNETIKGISGATHQIDVLCDFELGGFPYQTLMEIKNWKSPVKKEQIIAFHGILMDIPGQPHGVFVSSSGFQSGAMTYAKTHGIELITIKQEAGASAYFNAAFFSHYNTLDVSFTANNPLQQVELSNLCNSQAVFTEGVRLINPAGEIISANSFIEQLEEEQQQTAEQHVYFQNQRNNSIAYKSCRLSCALKEAWKAEYINEGKQFDITAIDASYEMRVVKIPINMSVSTVPKYIVMYLLAQHQKILKKTEEGFQICG